MPFDPSLLPQPSPSALARAQTLLGRALPSHRLTTEARTCEQFCSDDSGVPGRVPAAVVFAESLEDVRATLEVAQQTGVPVTPRAAATSRVGGAVPLAGGIVLCTTRWNQLKDIDRREQTAVVEPGLVLADFQAAVEAEGLFYPPDPSSLTRCTLGGNVATNAGGPRALKYGSTRSWVLGMDVATMHGDCFFAGRRTVKGVTGYDVAGLLVGSEGTLGVLGEITLRLTRKPAAVMSLVALFENVESAARCVQYLLDAGVLARCLELLDAPTLQAVRDLGNPIDTAARAMLLIELDGEMSSLEREAELVERACGQAGALELLAAQSPQHRDRLWAARRQLSPAVRRLAQHKLSEDVVVPRRHLVELINRIRSAGEQQDIRTLCYGHAGDGNLHVNFLWDTADEVPRVHASVEQLFRDVVSLGGTLTGEHGMGCTKAPYLGLEQSEPLIALQRSIQRVFDPKGLLNPHKIFPTGTRRGHGDC